ncbi:MbtH family protein [Neorhizobium sp. DT-125]|uniref:MbtH family protein n=1 Tax=Neorhizobium sp. DT-125 TaxID=3396163 RepID=UPI003F1C2241
MSWGDENTDFTVVINHEEQYSIWPTYKPIPDGWRSAGKTGKKAECLAYVEEVWTDMRPLSLRKALADRQATEKASA